LLKRAAKRIQPRRQVRAHRVPFVQKTAFAAPEAAFDAAFSSR